MTTWSLFSNPTQPRFERVTDDVHEHGPWRVRRLPAGDWLLCYVCRDVDAPAGGWEYVVGRAHDRPEAEQHARRLIARGWTPPELTGEQKAMLQRNGPRRRRQRRRR